jgi:hypothetical protein
MRPARIARMIGVTTHFELRQVDRDIDEPADHRRVDGVVAAS